MKNLRKLLFASMTLALLSAQVGACASGSVVVAGKQIALKSNFARRLQHTRRAGVTIVYPTFIPPGFKLNSVSISDDGDTAHPDFSLEFSNRKAKTFTVESANSGIGDGPDGDRQLKGHSSFFGNFTISVFKPGSEGNGTKFVYFLSSWMEDPKRAKSRIKNPEHPLGRNYHFFGEGISDRQALAIVESLHPVTAISSK